MPSLLTAPAALRTNDRSDPFGIDTLRPTFSWTSTSAQESYQVEVRRGNGDGDLVWDSGRIDGADPFGTRYAGEPLAGRTAYAWRVRLWSDERASGWSDDARFETGLLEPSDWTASWITGPPPADESDRSTLYVNRTLDLPAPVRRGRAYVSSLGWYRFFVNGLDLTAETLVPRWTPLASYVEYQVYDVTAQFTAGRNAIAVAVGDGRFRGALGAMSEHGHYGDRLAALVQIELDLEDGSTVTVVSDAEWMAGTGRIISSDPKLGQRVDLRIPDDDWLRGERPRGFFAAEVLPGRRVLIAEETGRVRAVDRRRGTVSTTPSGKQLVDFGQNLTGIARVRLSGPAGTIVTLTHTELATGGEADDRNLQVPWGKPWHQRDEVVLDGSTQWYEPWFSFRGFRYLEIDGSPTALQVDDVEAVVLSSDLRPIGEFSCSDPRIEQLYRNVVWSMRGNFLDVPTDCPTRERSGWTGDAQVFAPTAARLMDVRGYFRRYLRVLATEQRQDGRLPGYVPGDAPEGANVGRLTAFIERNTSSSAGWGDASVLIPWAQYEAYGDVTILEQAWPMMVRWVDRYEREAAAKRGRGRWFTRSIGDLERYIVGSGFHYGEWLRPDTNTLTDLLGLVARPPSVVATAYFEHSTRLLSSIAEVLGKTAESKRYTSLADKIREAWRAAFVRDRGARIGDDKQDDYVRALAFDLLSDDERAPALDRLVELIRAARDHLGTGFLSTVHLLPVLVEGGRADVAFDLLLQDTAPSWLHQIERGATTTWESWEGYDKRGRGQASHNHYSYGAVVQWLIDGLAGLAPAAPGYCRIRVSPTVGGGVSSAKAAIETPFGRAESAWQHRDGVVHLTVVVPPGTTADVHLGDGARHDVGTGRHEFAWTHGTTAGALPAAEER